MSESRPATHTSHAKLYLAVFGALAVLTVITVAVSYLHLSHGKAMALALFIASIKVALIASVFMHLKSESRWIHAFFYTAVIGVILLLVLVYPDLGVR